MTDRFQPLRDAIAAGPTPGPWMSSLPARPTPDAPEGGDCAILDSNGNIIAETFYRVGHGPGGTRPAAVNAAYIAAADPGTILALLDERDALREALEWYSAQAKRMGDAAIRQDSQAILVIMKEVAVDYGGRARTALAKATGAQP